MACQSWRFEDLQELAEDGWVSVRKVNGSDNAADILTKSVPTHLIDKHSATMDLSFPAGTECRLALQHDCVCKLGPLSDDANGVDRSCVHFVVVLTKKG